MKRYLIFSLIVLIFLSIQPSFLSAQGRDRSPYSGKDSAIKDLNLSDEQHNAIRRIRAAYVKKILKLKSNVMGKQLEFRGLIGDPATNEETIRSKGREIEALNGQIMREAIEYELSVRRILTPEQVRMWSTIDTSPPIRSSSGR